MSEISVIGLGLMGAALARAIQKNSHDLTVWNRTPGKMQPFIDDGVKAATDVASAINASPIILICIDNYTVTNDILQSGEVEGNLSGRTIIQLSTGTPNEAREAANWMQLREVPYLDGAILCGPKSIGTPSAQILLSGRQEAYESCKNLLRSLGERVRYVGANVGAASTLDLAWLSTCYGRFMSIIHAANMCRSENVSMSEFVSLFPDNPDIQHHAKVIENESYEHCTATLQVWGAALKRIQQQGMDANINTDFPDFVDRHFSQAVDAGYGEKNVMSLVKILENN